MTVDGDHLGLRRRGIGGEALDLGGGNLGRGARGRHPHDLARSKPGLAPGDDPPRQEN